MSSTISPNMSLIIPGVGSEPGPTYADDLNSSLTIVDQHNHTSGSGVLITVAAMDINTNFPMNNHLLTNTAGMTLTAQGSTPANNTVYESGVDLFFVDGNGNNVRITQSGSVAGTPGSISNLVAPASASYDGLNTFVFESNTSIAANLDCGAVLLRNLSPNSTFAVTLQAPAALSNNYSLTMPSLPASQKIMTLDNSGALAAPYTVDGTTIAIAANVIGVPNGGLTTTQLSASAGILGSQLSASAGILGSQLSASAAIVGTQLADGTVTSAKIETNVNLLGTAVKANTKNLVTALVNESTMYKIARAYVGSTGTVISGSGVTSVTVAGGTNEYTVTMASAFATVPCPTIVPRNNVTASPLFVTLSAQPTTTVVKFFLFDLAGVAQTGDFSFLAIAP